MTRVFVYGSLRSGESNHRYLATARPLGPATTARGYALYDYGQYAAIVREGEGAVSGELYEVDAPTLAELDRLEGHPSFYRRQSVTLSDGEEAEAYVQRPDQVRGKPLVKTGSWRDRERR
jgi:gamma-glutamylaminecyclotransferase